MGFLDIFKASENKRLKNELEQLQQAHSNLIATMPKEKKDFDALAQQSAKLQDDITRMIAEKSDLLDQNDSLSAAVSSMTTKLSKATNDLQKVSRLYEQFKAAVNGFEKDPNFSLPDIAVGEDLMPFITVELNCLNVKDLRARYRANQKEIQKVFSRYERRYSTKANSAIYKLMVIAMQAELINVLNTLSHGKLETAKDNICKITNRYYEIAVEGNQSIANTMKKFIAEIEVLFLEAINIEYEYYVKREQAREEQRALKEQMRQEAEERKALEAEKKKIEKEESKYSNEIRQLEENLSKATDETKLAALQERIAQLKAQMLQVQQKKEQIINLQNGKAGYVYVISNLGSFGSDVFKIGMTRRSEPMDRVKELGDASVPFSFDVHSFIFSQDAVGLENALHKQLNQQRVNRVNLRKEFFRISLDELEQIVLQHDPSAEFKRTMAAEQYYQSLNRDEVVPEMEYDLTDDE